MDFKSKWRILDEEAIGVGGQGKVYRVIDAVKYNVLYENSAPFTDALITLTIARHKPELDRKYEMFKSSIVKMVEAENPENWGALKVFHEPEEARDSELADAPIGNEIKAMNDISHTNLIEILDFDPDSKWFVSKFYPDGTLEERLNLYKGHLVSTLLSLRPLVAGVAEIHKAGYVHRDIKPKNIFIAHEGSLILGDFGLVYFEDDNHTRISKTYDNVGSRDWMPGWAMGMKIEEVKSTFDVYSLGKILWSMISGKPVLQLWYWNKKDNDPAKMFPDDNRMWLINNLLEKCVVEDESDCLENASELLKEIDNTLLVLKYNGPKFSDEAERKCKVCGVGNYMLKSDGEPGHTKQFGLQPVGDKRIKIFSCSNCGHIQFFFHPVGNVPPAWENN